MREFDIRAQGRRWSAEEMWRHDELPGRLDLIRGQLCLDEAQRLLLLGALLEHVGTSRAVHLGPLEAWVSAIEERKEDEAWANMPAVGAEQFWKASAWRMPFKKLLAMKQDLRLFRQARGRAMVKRRPRERSP